MFSAAATASLPNSPLGFSARSAVSIKHGDYHLDIQFINLDRNENLHAVKFPLDSILQTGRKRIRYRPAGHQQPASRLLQGGHQPDGQRQPHPGQQAVTFILTARADSLLPRVYSKLHPRFPHPEHLYTLASQYFMTGRFAQAKESAERLLQLQDSLNGRLLLSRIHFGLKNYEQALQLSRPIFHQTFDREAGKTAAASLAGHVELVRSYNHSRRTSQGCPGTSRSQSRRGMLSETGPAAKGPSSSSEIPSAQSLTSRKLKN